MPRLYIQDRIISPTDLLRATEEEAIPFYQELTAYSRSSLSFARAWLQGAGTFTLHTSGSTGTPKPITISRQQMQASARMTLRSLQLTAEDTALVCLNTAYIAGKMMIVRALEAGMDLLIVPPGSHPFAAVPSHISVRFTSMVPLQLQTLLAEGDAVQLSRLNGLKALLVGGAPVSPSLRQAIQQQVTAPVYATYGMTETVSHIALKKLNGPEDVYTVLQGTEIGTDDRGCLVISGEVTARQQIVTNDLVELTDRQHFRWIGRADNVINSGGYKVFPEKVESAIASFMEETIPGTLYMVAGVPDPQLGQKVVLVLESAPLSSLSEKKLLKMIKEKLHPYEIPRAVFYCPDFVLTESNKIQRKSTLQKVMGEEG